MEFKLQIDHCLLKLIAELDEFKGRWSATQLLAPDRLKALRQVATIESIGSSTRIEGAKLTDSEVEKLLSGVKAFSLRSRDEQEVAGYAEAMELIFSSHSEMTLSENLVKQLHGVLLKYSEKDEQHRGDYKKFPNHVEAFDAKGKSLGVVFQTASPFETPQKMKELVEWAQTAIQKTEIHSLLSISFFIVHFLAIHPFQDGNGRLSRILTTWLLLRAGYLYVAFSSFERIIEVNKEQYNLALRKAQSTLYGENSKLGDWVTFFLKSMVKQKAELEKKLEREMLLEKLPELSSQMVIHIRDHGRATIGNIVAVTQANRNTIKVHLKDLVDAGRLVRQGTGKGTWYKLP